MRSFHVYGETRDVFEGHRDDYVLYKSTSLEGPGYMELNCMIIGSPDFQIIAYEQLILSMISLTFLTQLTRVLTPFPLIQDFGFDEKSQ